MLQSEELLVLPLVVMGSLLVAGGACSLLLPETLNQHLPQSLEDGEKFGKEWSWRNLAACCSSRYNWNWLINRVQWQTFVPVALNRTNG